MISVSSLGFFLSFGSLFKCWCISTLADIHLLDVFLSSFIISDKAFSSVFSFYGAFWSNDYSHWLFRVLHPDAFSKAYLKKRMPGSHLISRSLSPQYLRPVESLPSCSGWVRVFLSSASPPDNSFLLFIVPFPSSVNKELTHRPLLLP